MPKDYVITAPLSGVFYRRPSPEGEPFAEIGKRVEEEMICCIVETMKVFNDVRSEKSGVVKEILVEDEDMVIVNQPLMIIEPD